MNHGLLIYKTTYHHYGSHSRNTFVELPSLLNPWVLSLLWLKLHGSAFFVGKLVVLHLLEGPGLRMQY